MAWWDALLDALALLAPVECAGCGAQDRSLCASCRGLLVAAPTPRVTPGGLTVLTALRYEGVVRRVILGFKEQQRTDVAGVLATALSAALAGMPPGVGLVPVPTSRAAFRRRGYDPVAVLLRRAGVRPLQALAPTRRTVRQKSLGVEDRVANRRGAFTARGPVDGRQAVIVDDVLTSGATFDEAARALSAAGAEVVGGVALAFTPRWSGFRDIPSDEDYGWAKGAQ